jgi:hypothetical protein
MHRKTLTTLTITAAFLLVLRLHLLASVSPPVIFMSLTSTNTVLLSWAGQFSGYAVMEKSDLQSNWVTLTNSPILAMGTGTLFALLSLA